jgi:hypothetical protein
MNHRGFTHQELRDIFDLNPDRPQDRPAIAALRASSTRRLVEPPTHVAHRTVWVVVKQLLRKRRWQAA